MGERLEPARMGFLVMEEHRDVQLLPLQPVDADISCSDNRIRA
jgi:hypothetical protein